VLPARSVRGEGSSGAAESDSAAEEASSEASGLLEAASPRNSSIERDGGAGAGGAAGKLKTLIGFGSSTAGSRWLSGCDFTGAAGLVVTVAEAAGCTFSCEPIEMKVVSGLPTGAAGTGAAGASFASLANGLASSGFCVADLAAAAGAQETSWADETGAAGFSMALGSAATGAADGTVLFARGEASEGK